jgi:hypothetical protein
VHESRTYEAPTLTKVGSVIDMTLGEGWRGNDDTFVLQIGRFQIPIHYGEAS